MIPSDERTTRDFLYFMESRYTDERNSAEAQVVWDLAKLQPGLSVLDLACGWGRIAHLLADRGAVVHGIDVDPVMIDAAVKGSASSATFEVRDMRALEGLPEYDVIICWWSSFGIFDDATDFDILTKLRRLLRPGGRLLIETANGPRFYVEAEANPSGKTLVTRSGADFLIDERRMTDDGQRMVGSRLVVRDGRVGEMAYDIRVFTGFELSNWMRHAGFTQVELFARSGEQLRRSSYSFVAVGSA